MKKLFLIAIALFTFSSSKAQSDSSYLELGVNAVRLVNIGLVDRDLNTDVWNPYMLTGSYGMKRFSLRFGMGYESTFRQELPTVSNGQTTTDTTSKHVDVRFGAGWEIGLGEKWSVKLGADFISSQRFAGFEAKFTNEAGELVENIHEFSYDEKGVSPFIYIQRHLSKKVSVGTEILWRMSAYSMTDSDKSNLNSAQIIKEYEGTKRILQAPTALFVNVRF
jgi:hypothetical protein